MVRLMANCFPKITSVGGGGGGGGGGVSLVPIFPLREQKIIDNREKWLTDLVF